MPPPAAKKQRRSIVQGSDEEGGSHKENKTRSDSNSNGTHDVEKDGGTESFRVLPTRTRSKAKTSFRKPSSVISRDATPTSSPKKAVRTTQKATKPTSLYSFFNAATQTQRTTEIRSVEPNSVGVGEEDFIQDDSLDEELQRLVNVQDVNTSVWRRQKRSHELSPERKPASKNDLLLSGSQKFLVAVKTPKQSTDHTSKTVSNQDRRPWAEKYAPTNMDELAVHKKKVADRLLVLKGPSGAGKTSTISTLAKLLDFEITEWKNPTTSELSSDNFVSMSTLFAEFLGRSGKFGNLTLQQAENQDVSLAPSRLNRRKVILLEEFPNTFSRTSSALLSFRSNILEHLAASGSSTEVRPSRQQQDQEDVIPTIIIISETLLTSSTAAADSFTAHRLLGPEILNHLATTVMEFNPIAPTLLMKALDLVIQKEARHSRRRRTPGIALLRKLSEVGDIRSALGSLEFLCVGGDKGSDWSGRVVTKGKAGAGESSALTKKEQESIEMVTQREATLGIFHAVGKVIYNKRDDIDAANSQWKPPAQPPDHLSHHVRSKVSQVNVEQLIDETGTETSTFVAALHENYVLSCDGSTFIESLNGCIDALSDSDLLSPDRRSGIHNYTTNNHNAYQSVGVQNLRQDELCFQIAVRGLLFCLPHPVKRRTRFAHSSTRTDAFKVWYPTSLRLWKQAEEVESLIDRWTDAAARTGLSPNQLLKHGTRRGTVESWGSDFPSQDPTALQFSLRSASEHEPPAPLLITASTRPEAILERLPYTAIISRAIDPTSTSTRELNTMTQFKGTVAPIDHEPDEQVDLGILPAAPTVSHAKGFAASKHLDEDKGRESGLGVPVESAVEKLVLSDDDIVDD